MKRQRPQPLSDRMLELCTVVFAFCLSSSAAYANSDVLEFLFTLYIYIQWHPTPILLPGKSHGQRSLVGCSPWGRGESDMTERLHLHFSLSCTGEGNGNPLQHSFLENPLDRGGWWAIVHRVTKSRMQPCTYTWNLKRDTDEFTMKQKQTHRYRKQACDCQAGSRWGRDRLEAWY